jgi:hypothetical protein
METQEGRDRFESEDELAEWLTEDRVSYDGADLAPALIQLATHLGGHGHVVESRPARLVGERTAGVVGCGKRWFELMVTSRAPFLIRAGETL